MKNIRDRLPKSFWLVKSEVTGGTLLAFNKAYYDFTKEVLVIIMISQKKF